MYLQSLKRKSQQKSIKHSLQQAYEYRKALIMKNIWQVFGKSISLISYFYPDVNISSCSLPGEDKGKGNRYQHFHAKEWLPASGGEPVHPAALHVLLHPTSLQPPSAVPAVQPDHTAGLVHHTQLH